MLTLKVSALFSGRPIVMLSGTFSGTGSAVGVPERIVSGGTHCVGSPETVADSFGIAFSFGIPSENPSYVDRAKKSQIEEFDGPSICLANPDPALYYIRLDSLPLAKLISAGNKNDAVAPAVAVAPQTTAVVENEDWDVKN
ncbi:hypothetical protein B0H14DRAFT_2557380 [Mycena olivaceomarginata]|nr:hypothetical protein B0H14DRAFT_2557380 [Mycena olivaceomarginata]